jgi:glycosyltransferase involved in cell wall biosynthesis
VSAYKNIVRRLKRIDDFYPVPIWIKFRVKSLLDATLLSNTIWLEQKIDDTYLDFEAANFENDSSPLIVIDVQCLRNKTFYRGIGRYTLSLVKAMAENSPATNILLFASNIGEEGNTPKVNEFVKKLNLPNLKFSVLDFFKDQVQISHQDSEKILSEILLRRKPHAVIVPSHFEHPFDAVHILPTDKLNIWVIIHDIIPWRFKEELLPSNKQRLFYSARIKELSVVRGLLSVSTFTATDVARELLDSTHISVIGGAGYAPSFKTKPLSPNSKSGIFCVGAETPHKNIPRLLKAYSLMSESIRKEHPLIIAGLHSESHQRRIFRECIELGIKVELPELLTDEEMHAFYAEAKVVVVPSLSEGLSMPVIESWTAGTVALGSRGTVLEEVIFEERLLFDPYSPENMAEIMTRLLTNDELYEELLAKSIQRLTIYNWAKVAENLHAILFKS